MPRLRSGMFIGWRAINISLQRSERHVAREERKTRRSRGAKNLSLERAKKPVAPEERKTRRSRGAKDTSLPEERKHVAREERKTRRSRGAKKLSLEGAKSQPSLTRERYAKTTRSEEHTPELQSRGP